MDRECTVEKTIDIISKRWSLFIVLSIYKDNNNSKRYNQIKNDLKDITPKMLSLRLKELETEGIIKKMIDSTNIPIKTFYSLTDCGKDLITILQDIKLWGLKWKFENKICKNTACKECILQ
ncbi:MAG: helix-turn-helix transcriptional regulator [DPANN group archaeon]|nr:helix-turn-helix transcriptional regulator [DPANN group archaeon]